MEGFWQFAGHYWWLIFPVGAVVGGWLGRAEKFRERRHRERVELERLRLQAMTAGGPQQAEPPVTNAYRPAPWELDRMLAEHDEVSRRWLEYELDVAKLIDFPLMTDMREESTREFHRAKRAADALRPETDAERESTLADRERLSAYRDAVQAYQLAFDAAEREARRRSQRDFSDDERSRLQTARRLLGLAVDDAATSAERQSAYRQAKRELDGLIVLPDGTTADLEQRIAGELGA